MNTRATPEPVAPTPDQMVRLADVIAVIDDNQYALERVPVGWNLLVKIRAGINAIPVAPIPSPDIAGLVERAKNYVNDPDQLEHCDPKYLSDDLEEFATALQRVAQERDAKQVHIETLQAVLAAAEARIATARDEGMEMAAAACERQSAVFGSTDYATGQPLSSFAERFACERCAEDIRELMGTKP